ncbi:MAG: InlB B-repeat-containing protein [Thermoprotei archaeon]
MSSLLGKAISGLMAAVLLLSLMAAAVLAYELAFSSASSAVTRYEGSAYLVQQKDRQAIKVNADNYPLVKVSGDGVLAWALVPVTSGTSPLARLNLSLRGGTLINLTEIFGFTPSRVILVTSLGNVYQVFGSSPSLSSNVTVARPGNHIMLYVKKGDHPLYELSWNDFRIAFGWKNSNYTVVMPNVPGGSLVKAVVTFFSGQWQPEASQQLLIECEGSSQGSVHNISPKGSHPEGGWTETSSATQESGKETSTSGSLGNDVWPWWIVVIGIPPNSRATVLVGSHTLVLQPDEAAMDPEPRAEVHPEPLKVGDTEYAATKVQEGKYLTITYAPESYLVKVTEIGKGVAEPSSGWYPAASMITLSALPEKGYRFADWIGNAYTGVSPSKMVIVNGPISELAYFIPLRPAPSQIRGKLELAPPQPQPPKMVSKEGQATPKRFLPGSFSSLLL